MILKKMKKKPARRIDFNQRKKRIGNILHFELSNKIQSENYTSALLGFSNEVDYQKIKIIDMWIFIENFSKT